MSNMRTCRVCNQPNTIDQYHKDKNYKDGMSTRCKTCAKEAYALYYSENIDKVNSARRARYMNKRRVRNPNKLKAQVTDGLPLNKHDINTGSLIKRLALVAQRSKTPRIIISSILDDIRAAYSNECAD